MGRFLQTALTSVDSYKLGHAPMYPKGTNKVYSNFTPRSMAHFAVPKEFKDNKMVWAGFKIFLEELVYFWDETFFKQPIETVVAEFDAFVAPFVGPNGFDASHIRKLHALGYLPLTIKALPEGSKVNIGVPVLTITNNVAHAFWLPNYLETWMSCEMWKTPTSATISHVYRRIINKYAELTGGNKDFITWQGHDFSVRGMSGIVDAAKSGFGHLLSFSGTDNCPAVKLANDVYGGQGTFVGGSVPATEHSVMCAGGKETEYETFKRLVLDFPSGVISIVSDTWDFWNVVGGPNSLAARLKPEIMARKPDQYGNAKVVFRPDSGDPVKIICGYKYWDIDTYGPPNEAEMADNGYEAVKVDGKFYKADFSYFTDGSPDAVRFGKELTEYEVKGAVECLWDTFGGTTNAKGFRTLDSHVGLIYGDSITTQRAVAILEQLMAKKFASDNIVLGIGSFTFQYNTRDTMGFAMKATSVIIGDVLTSIFKDPKTDAGTKKSARGLLKVVKVGDDFKLLDNVTEAEEKEGELQVVFCDGKIIFTDDIATIRARLATQV